MVEAISGFSEIDPVSIAQMSVASRTKPTPLLAAARMHPSIIDHFGSVLTASVSEDVKKAAKLIDVKDEMRKGLYHIPKEMPRSTINAAQMHASISDIFLRQLLDKHEDQTS